MKYNVTAHAVNRITAEKISLSKVEEIDTVTNKLFHGCETPQDIKVKYESFWNDMNLTSEEVIYVTSIELI